jgi:outer membrane protein assembly factor BamB
MKQFRTISIILYFSFFQFLSIAAQEIGWQQFRASNLSGISGEKDVPTHWNDSINLLWRTTIPGKGWSSPVVYGDQIWLTSASDDGKELSAICTDLKSGKELFNIKLFEPATVYSKHDINGYASPTPCIENEFVYIHFGTYGTACIRTDNGSIIWKRTDLNCNHVQGSGSSPIIYKNLLILHLEGVDVQYIIALDKFTGKTVWQKDRPSDIYYKLPEIGKKAYITPLIVNVKGKDLLISNGSAACIAYEPETGKEIWWVVQGEDSTISSPFGEDGVVYFYTSFVTPPD